MYRKSILVCQVRVQQIVSSHMTEEHHRIVKMLSRVSMSAYAEVSHFILGRIYFYIHLTAAIFHFQSRKVGQAVLSRVLREFTYSFTLVIDDILEALRPCPALILCDFVACPALGLEGQA